MGLTRTIPPCWCIASGWVIDLRQAARLWEVAAVRAPRPPNEALGTGSQPHRADDTYSITHPIALCVADRWDAMWTWHSALQKQVFHSSPRTVFTPSTALDSQSLDRPLHASAGVLDVEHSQRVLSWLVGARCITVWCVSGIRPIRTVLRAVPRLPFPSRTRRLLADVV